MDAVRVHRPARRPREPRPGGPRGRPRRRREPLAKLPPHHDAGDPAGHHDDRPHPPDQGLQDHRHAEHPARRRARDRDPVDDPPGVHRLEHPQPRAIGGDRLPPPDPRLRRRHGLRQLRAAKGHGPGMRNPFARRSVTDMSPPAKLGAFLILVFWAFVVLFPIYWLFVTSFKTPYQVDKGPFYIPFVDFQPTLDAWRYILVELGNDTLRPYMNTVIVGLSSAVIALVMGAAAAYALVRFTYRARVGIIGLGIGSGALAVVASLLGAPPILAVAAAVAVFAILAQTIGRRFTRAMGNSDIAFWLISQRILPPIAVAIPLYVLYQQVGLLDNIVALIITYVATNLPIVVWLM